MAIQFRTTRVRFDPTKGRTQKENASLNFSKSVKRILGFAINGFRIRYTDVDHELKEQLINIEETNAVRSGSNVRVPVAFLLRDSSGHIDDRFDGWVDVLGIAEV